MKAMIFAAGLGTRLHPLTLTKPKALVEVNGEPMLQKIILKIKSAGVNHLVVNVHHFSHQVADFLRVNGYFGLHIAISDESSKLLDTGGGLLQAAPMLAGDEPVLVHNADILTDFPIPEMMRSHEESGADVTLLASPRQSSRHLLFDPTGRMVGWNNSNTGEYRPAGVENMHDTSELAFGGVHIFSPKALAALTRYGHPHDAFSIIPFYTDCCRELNIRAYLPSAPYHWYDIGKPATLQAARESGL